MYDNPAAASEGTNVTIPEEVLQQHFDEFFGDVYEQMTTFGTIEQLNIIANTGDHMMGNVYVLYDDEEASAKALTALAGRFYAGKALVPEMSVVTDFHEARCRAYDENNCQRGGQCNFMHIMRPSPAVCDKLQYRPLFQAPGGRSQYERGGRDEREGRDGRDRDSRREAPGGRRKEDDRRRDGDRRRDDDRRRGDDRRGDDRRRDDRSSAGGGRRPLRTERGDRNPEREERRSERRTSRDTDPHGEAVPESGGGEEGKVLVKNKEEVEDTKPETPIETLPVEEDKEAGLMQY